MRRSRVFITLAGLAASVSAVAVPPVTHAGPRLLGHPGNGAAAVFIARTLAPGFTSGYTYNSARGAVTAGHTSDHYWVKFAGLGGSSYANAQLTVWGGGHNPPMCTVDSAKDNGSDVVVSFQCIPFPGLSLAGTSVFVNVTNGPHPDRSGTTAPGFVAVTTTSATAPLQTPANQYRSSGLGSVTVARIGVGTYRVTIPHAAYGRLGGVAFATAVSVSPAVDPFYSRYCNVWNWFPAGTSTVVNLKCFMGAGSPADDRFSLRFTKRSIVGGAQAGGTQFVAYPLTASYTASGFGWNSTGSGNVIHNNSAAEGAGASMVTFGGATSYPKLAMSVLVSGYGSNNRCSLQYPGTTPPSSVTAYVRCSHPFSSVGAAGATYMVGVAQFP